MAQKKTKNEVYSSLIEQLETMGAAQDHYIDLINDYMDLWNVKTKLFQDIKKRGVTYEDVSSVGVKMQKNNPSVKEVVMVNRQMLSILKELGIVTSAATDGEEYEL